MRPKAHNIFRTLYRVWIFFAVITCDLVKSLHNSRELENKFGMGKSSAQQAFKNKFKNVVLFNSNVTDSVSAGKSLPHYNVESNKVSDEHGSALITTAVANIPIPRWGSKWKAKQRQDIIEARSKRQVGGSNYTGREISSFTTQRVYVASKRATPSLGSFHWKIATTDVIKSHHHHALSPLSYNDRKTATQSLPKNIHTPFNSPMPTPVSVGQIYYQSTSIHPKNKGAEERIHSAFFKIIGESRDSTTSKDDSSAKTKLHSSSFNEKLGSNNKNPSLVITKALHVHQQQAIKLEKNKSAISVAKPNNHIILNKDKEKNATDLNSDGNKSQVTLPQKILWNVDYEYKSTTQNAYILPTQSEHYNLTSEEVIVSAKVTTPQPFETGEMPPASEIFYARTGSSAQSHQKLTMNTSEYLTTFTREAHQNDDINIKVDGIKQSTRETKSLTSVMSTGDGTISNTDHFTNNTWVEDKHNNSKEKEDLILEFKSKYPVKLWKKLGLLKDEFLENIDSHWMKYDPPNTAVHIIFATIYGLFMIVGCGGNFLVIFMFARCRSLRTPPNYLILNLAISDFFMMAKTPIYIINSFYYGPALGQLGCSVYGFVGGLTGTTSIMTLASISLDRYYAIVHPLNPFKRTTFRRAILMIICVWTYAAVFSSLPLFGVNKYTSEGYLTSCSFDYLSENVQSRSFVFIFFIAAWCVPLVVIIYSYFNIYRMVRSAERMEAFAVGNVKQAARESFKFKSGMEKQRSEMKIALLAGILISLWTIAWSPYALVALLGIFGGKSFLTPLVSAIPAIFCKTASCVNPFIYFINHPRFQRELKSHFPVSLRNCFIVRKESRGDDSYSTTSYHGNKNSSERNGQTFGISRDTSVKRRPPLVSPEKSKRSLRSWDNKSNKTTAKEAQINSSLVHSHTITQSKFMPGIPPTGIDLHSQL